MSAVTSLEYSLPFITRSKPSLDALSLSTSAVWQLAAASVRLISIRSNSAVPIRYWYVRVFIKAPAACREDKKTAPDGFADRQSGTHLLRNINASLQCNDSNVKSDIMPFTVGQKISLRIWLPSSPNIDRFSQFFTGTFYETYAIRNY